MSSDDQVNSHTIFAIISGLLFTLSEILPFISKIESNGLINFLVNVGNQMLKKKENDETEPLLPLYNPARKKKRAQIEIGSEDERSEDERSDEEQNGESDQQNKSKFKKIKQSETENVSENKNESKKIKQQDENKTESKQIEQFKENDRLKTSEEYELEFLKTHIKTNYLDHIIILPSLHKCNQQELENNGYKIFYDHIDDKYTLKW